MRTTTELFLITIIQLLLVSSFLSSMSSGLTSYDPSEDSLRNVLETLIKAPNPANPPDPNDIISGVIYSIGTWASTLMGDESGKAVTYFVQFILLIVVGIPVFVLYTIQMVGVSCAAVWQIPLVGPIIGIWWIGTIVMWAVSSMPTMGKS